MKYKIEINNSKKKLSILSIEKKQQMNENYSFKGINHSSKIIHATLLLHITITIY